MLYEGWQDRFGKSIYEILLLTQVGVQGAGGRVIARWLVASNRRCWQSGCSQCRDYSSRKRDTGILTRAVVNDDGLEHRKTLVHRPELRNVLNGSRTELSDGSGGITGIAGSRQQAFFIHVVSFVVIVKIGKNLVVFDEWRDRPGDLPKIAAVVNGVSGIKIIAEGAGVSEVVTCSNGRTVRHRECRKDRVTVRELDAFPAKAEDGRRVERIYRSRSQPVGNEDDYVPAAVPGWCRSIGCKRRCDK